MSDLLNQASLVMVPSGYKEDTVYSVVPSDGSGDLSFTRASNGTRVNSAGLVEVCPWNLATYSEEFDNAAWTKLNSTITANSVSAPNGTTTADTITDDSTNGVHRAINSVSVVNGGVYTYSVYLKNGNINYAVLKISSGVNFAILINLSTKTITSTVGSVTASISNEGDWARCIFTFTAQDTTATMQVATSSGTMDGDGNSIYVGTGKYCYIWGAQLNIGSTAKPYFPTTDRLNVPRLTYQNGGGGCPSLLLEKQSTNLITYSEQFDNAAWIKSQVSVTANAGTSPDGYQNADKVIADTSSGSHLLFQSISASISSGTTYTYSFFAKAAEYTKAAIRIGGSGYASQPMAAINLSTGAIISQQGFTSVSVVSYGNGWYRIAGTYVATSVVAPNIWPLSDSFTTTSDSYTFTGNGTSGILAFGTMHEEGSYATSYIPTTSSSATRVADACFKTGISSLIGQTEGVLFADVNRIQKSQNYNVAIFIGLWPSVIDVYFDNSNQIICIVYVSGVLQTTLNGGVLANGRHKIAVAYKQNDFVMYVDGAQVATSYSGSVPTCSQLIIGNDDSTLYHLNDSINEAVIFPTRLTNAELASLTTI